MGLASTVFASGFVFGIGNTGVELGLAFDFVALGFVTIGWLVYLFGDDTHRLAFFCNFVFTTTNVFLWIMVLHVSPIIEDIS